MLIIVIIFVIIVFSINSDKSKKVGSSDASKEDDKCEFNVEIKISDDGSTANDDEDDVDDTISPGTRVLIPIPGESSGVVMATFGSMAIVESNVTHKRYNVPISGLIVL